jgi:hypothetical protein
MKISVLCASKKIINALSYKDFAVPVPSHAGLPLFYDVEIKLTKTG